MNMELLYDRYLRHRRVSTDSRRIAAGDIFFALRGDRFDGNKFVAETLQAGAQLVVMDDQAVADRLDYPALEAGVEGPAYLRVDDSLKVLQDLARHHRRQWVCPVIAITGSNGKTTTKELVNAVMSRRYQVHVTAGNYNNHIGLPLTILSAPADLEACILEMGANHQGEIAELCRIAEPTHGLITNIGMAHLDGFGGREGIIKGKGELYDWLAAHAGVGFVNLDEKELPQMAERLSRRIDYARSEEPRAENKPFEIRLLATEPNCRVGFLADGHRYFTAQTQLPGLHNFENIKSAIAVGKYFKVEGQDIVEALESYTPTNARSQRMQCSGVDFYWDAYNANPSSVIATLDALKQLNEGKPAAILGQMLELGKEAENLHLKVAQYALDRGFEPLVLVGPAYREAATTLDVPYFEDSESLKEWFWKQDWQGKLVLVKGSRGVALEKILPQ